MEFLVGYVFGVLSGALIVALIWWAEKDSVMLEDKHH